MGDRQRKARPTTIEYNTFHDHDRIFRLRVAGNKLSATQATCQIEHEGEAQPHLGVISGSGWLVGPIVAIRAPGHSFISKVVSWATLHRLLHPS